MKILMMAAAFAVLSASVAGAGTDPVHVRKSIMASNGASAGLAVKLMKGEVRYDPAVAKSVLEAIHVNALTIGDYFPEGSGTGRETDASPKIWEDAEGFAKAVAKFQADASEALKASGRGGPADLAAFKTAIEPVFGDCKSCHQVYRVDR